MTNWVGRYITYIGIFLLISSGTCLAQVSILDIPGSMNTVINGVDGSNLIGMYQDNMGYHGFVYNGGSYTTLNDPAAGASLETYAAGMFNNTIVGGYQDRNGNHGFIYSNGQYTTIDVPGTDVNTYVRGIYGNSVYGFYTSPDSRTYGFIYNAGTFTTVNVPGAVAGTEINGIVGNTIIGSYSDLNGTHGFVYDGSKYITLDDPASFYPSGSEWYTQAWGISGTNIVGDYQPNRSGSEVAAFLFNGSTYTMLDIPGSVSTHATAIQGNTIVGFTLDTNSQNHGFIYTLSVPESHSIVLLAILGMTGFSLLRCRK
jgi:hypothetical protein